MRKLNTYKIIGIIFIVSAVILNEWTINQLLNYETNLYSTIKSLIIFSFQLISISIGYFLYRKGKVAFQNILLLFISFLIFVVLLEIILSMPFAQDLESSAPIWIPKKYKDLTRQINKQHDETSSKNKFGFNDSNHTFKNEHGKRIAILGDSFTWGDAVPDSVIWTKKLETKFVENGYDVEILNWGKSGWSTLDQYHFLIEDGNLFQFDYLIFSFVNNDPVMDSSYHKRLIYNSGFLYKKILKPIEYVFPNTISFCLDLSNNFLSSYSDYGYHNWLNNNVYSEENLKKYSLLLQNIKQYCDEREIEFLFVMTPENHNPIIDVYFNKVIALFNQNKIPYLNLFPMVEGELKNYTSRELWANPADGHPGNLVTTVYANSIYNFFIERQFVIR